MQAAILLAIVGASHCFLLAVVSHLQSQVPRASDKILTSILVIEGLRLAAMAAIGMGLAGIWLYLHSLRFAAGPLLFFYTLYLVGRPVALSWSSARHFLPLGLLTLVIFLNHTGLLNIPRQALVPPVAFVEGLLFLVYGLVSRRTLKSYRRSLLQTHSSVEHINLDWLRYVCVYIMGMGVVLIIGGVFLQVFPQTYSLNNAIVASSLTTMVFCYVISLKGIQQSRLFERLLVEESLAPAVVEEEPQDKYQTSSMSKEDADDFYRVLLEVMGSEQLFLKPKLKLRDLASATGMHPQQVSQVINQCTEKSFYDFVNNYRVEEALRLLQAEGGESSNILDIAHQSGFNTAATFYKYFRKYTGKTPKDVLRAKAA
jgi:AraC-like DNA-binding protein